MKKSLAVLFLFGLGGCGAPPVVNRPPPSRVVAGAAAGVENGKLAALLREHFDWTLQVSPVFATTLGDHRFDHQLPRVSAAAIADQRAAIRRFLEQARALKEQLSPADQLTLRLFIGELESQTAIEVCEFHQWTVSPRDNAPTAFNRLPEDHRGRSEQDLQNLLLRYQSIPAFIDDSAANLRAGAAAGLFADAESIRRTIEQLQQELKKPVEEWPLYQPVTSMRKGTIPWPVVVGPMSAAVDEIRLASERYLKALEQLLPRARGDKAAGIVAMPNGQRCYRALISHHTGLEFTPEELHQIGLRELEKINREMLDLGKRLFAQNQLPAILKKLRTDPTLYFTTRQEVLAAAEQAVDKARQKVSEAFARLPKTDVKVVEIPDYEAPYTTIAYYNSPHADGSKIGEYFINTYKPEVRPRFEQEVLAYHEAIPGHHTERALAQELGDLPMFRRHGGNTAFIEGWALYTERLADELGLYSGDLDRMGMLSYDAWRASRLVVDTGIHALGWTRKQAEDFMMERTALSKENIVNEVDRYISWPGQALAYKVGQLEIFRLRELARTTRGSAFDLKAFHDAVLKNGAVTLPVLREQIRAFLAPVDAAQ